eukprot:5867694-Prymnesium_polylepis.1
MAWATPRHNCHCRFFSTCGSHTGLHKCAASTHRNVTTVVTPASSGGTSSEPPHGPSTSTRSTAVVTLTSRHGLGAEFSARWRCLYVARRASPNCMIVVSGPCIWLHVQARWRTKRTWSTCSTSCPCASCACSSTNLRTSAGSPSDASHPGKMSVRFSPR